MQYHSESLRCSRPPSEDDILDFANGVMLPMAMEAMEAATIDQEKVADIKLFFNILTFKWFLHYTPY